MITTRKSNKVNFLNKKAFRKSPLKRFVIGPIGLIGPIFFNILFIIFYRSYGTYRTYIFHHFIYEYCGSCIFLIKIMFLIKNLVYDWLVLQLKVWLSIL